MKRYIFLLGVMALLIPNACENLDQEMVTTISPEQVNKSYDYTKGRALAVYSTMKSGFYSVNGAMLASACDEAEFTLETASVQYFNTGFWNPAYNPDDVWSNSFLGIRRANDFLANSDSVDLDVYKLNPSASAQTTYTTRMAEIANWKVEVRFLRAFFYFELVKRYGGVPIITEALSLEDDYMKYKRNTLAECVKFITDECDSAARLLPLKAGYGTADLGRATRGAALALKSRVLLYAASDLFNTPTWATGYAHPELISLTGDRMAKWKEAADAAKALINLNDYVLASKYTDLFGSSNYSNNEVIFARRGGPDNYFDKLNTPISYDEGQSGNTPSQNLVDAYEMKTGVKFDWNNTTHAADPYANRDPRLTMSILVNNTTYKKKPVEIWTGGLSGKGTPQATRTGYYLRKYVDEGLDLLQNKTSVHSWVIFRLAEFYLNYAEALNEYDPGNADIAKYVNLVRDRAGVKMPAIPAGLTQSEMRARIRNERRVELAFEEHRFWDVRRWMVAEQELAAPLKGVEITKTGTTFTYTPIEVESRVFVPKMYFYPIPISELGIQKEWSQNPLW